MHGEPLSYIEWAFLAWAADKPKVHYFYITGGKVISQFEFTGEADKAAKALVDRGYFAANDHQCYKITSRGMGVAVSAEAPLWVKPSPPKPIGTVEQSVLAALYDQGASTQWVQLSRLENISRAKLVGALQNLVAHGMAMTTQRPGSEVITLDDVSRPSLFRQSRFSWHYLLTAHGVDALCELEISQVETNIEIPE